MSGRLRSANASATRCGSCRRSVNCTSAGPQLAALHRRRERTRCQRHFHRQRAPRTASAGTAGGRWSRGCRRCLPRACLPVPSSASASGARWRCPKPSPPATPTACALHRARPRHSRLPAGRWPPRWSRRSPPSPGGLLGSSTLNGHVTLFVCSFTETPADPAHTSTVAIRVAFDANGNQARLTSAAGRSGMPSGTPCRWASSTRRCA